MYFYPINIFKSRKKKQANKKGIRTINTFSEAIFFVCKINVSVDILVMKIVEPEIQ